MADPTNWRIRAACKGSDTGLFFPNKHTSTDEPKRLCESCPVRADCLEDALATRDLHGGIRGGKTVEERRVLLRKRPPAPKADHTADIIRLTAMRWTPPAIAARYGIDTNTVYRVLKVHRAKQREEEAAA